MIAPSKSNLWYLAFAHMRSRLAEHQFGYELCNDPITVGYSSHFSLVFKFATAFARCALPWQSSDPF